MSHPLKPAPEASARSVTLLARLEKLEQDQTHYMFILSDEEYRHWHTESDAELDAIERKLARTDHRINQVFAQIPREHIIWPQGSNPELFYGPDEETDRVPTNQQ